MWILEGEHTNPRFAGCGPGEVLGFQCTRRSGVKARWVLLLPCDIACYYVVISFEV